MQYWKKFTLTAAILATNTIPTFAAAGSDDPEILITDGEFFGEVRYRYENVEQDGFTNDADAHTVRTNLGFKTGTYKGFQALIEGQIIRNMGDEDFNSTTNGKPHSPSSPTRTRRRSTSSGYRIPASHKQKSKQAAKK